MTMTCSYCGAHDGHLAGIGPLSVVRDDDAPALIRLFMKQLDDYVHDVCQRPTGIRPTIVIHRTEDRRYLCCYGDLARAAPKQAREVFLRGLEPGHRIRQFESTDDLRAAYAAAAGRMIKPVFAAIARDLSDLNDVLYKSGWRAVTASHFAAARLVISANVPGLRILALDPDMQRARRPAGADLQKIEESVATLQARVWLALCDSWRKDAPGRTLEKLLDRHLAPGAIFRAGAEQFITATQSREGWSDPAWFCVETIRATLFAWLGQPNPRLTEWAELFVIDELRRRLATKPVDRAVAATEISARRARDTIPFPNLYDACVRVVSRASTAAVEERRSVEFFECFRHIGEKIGYLDLIVSIVEGFRVESTTLKNFGIAIRSVDSDDPKVVLRIADLWFRAIDQDWSPDLLYAAANELRKVLGEHDVGKAAAEWWICKWLFEHDLPQKVLDRIGTEAAPWEDALDLEWQSLAVVRAKALRLTGQRSAAVAILESLAARLAEAGIQPAEEIERDLAALYRDTGRQEEALAILERLLLAAEGVSRVELLLGIAHTYGSVGRFSEAMTRLDQAERLARGPNQLMRAEVLAVMAVVRIANHDPAGALNVLREVTTQANLEDVQVLTACASAWLNVVQRPELIGADDQPRLALVWDALKGAFEATHERGNIHAHVAITRLLAFWNELLHIDDRNIFWRAVDENAREYEHAPDPVALLALARGCLEDGDRDGAMELLLELPDAMSTRFRAERSLDFKLQSFSNLTSFFDDVVDLVALPPAMPPGAFVPEVASAQPTLQADKIRPLNTLNQDARGLDIRNLRIVGELRRDVLGRAAAEPAGGGLAAGSGFIAPNATSIAGLEGPLAVLEWVGSDEHLFGLMTVVTGVGGEVREEVLAPPRIDLSALGRRLDQKLAGWHRGRAGDPFDMADWKAFEAWLEQKLTALVPAGARLVVIEHEQTAGLQWHVAAGARWRTSYAPSWSAILALRGRGGVPQPLTLGVVEVPRFRESAAVAAALERSRSRAEALATDLRIGLRVERGAACDAAALRALLQRVSVAKLLCHGYVDPADSNVALMIAHSGALPLADSVAAGTSEGQLHRFGWRDCAGLTAAPTVVFAAACSSGQAYVQGLGERLGLFGALRCKGTRSLVAPRWDIDPEIVLPILDEVMEAHLRQGCDLDEALIAASSRASLSQPKWLAWALSLEGSWKGAGAVR